MQHLSYDFIALSYSTVDLNSSALQKKKNSTNDIALFSLRIHRVRNNSSVLFAIISEEREDQ